MKLLQAARLSRLDDASTGILKQDQEAQRYAALGGHQIVATAADTDVSGDTDPWSRPELGPWLTDPTLIAQYDGIIASHIDRLARSTIHFMRLLHWADEHGKRIITTGEQGIDFSTPVGKLLGYIISWLGEQELAAITRRSGATQKYLRDSGYLVGKAPFGYCITEKDDHKTLTPDPVTGPIARELVERYLNGETLADLCEWLDTQTPPPNGAEHWGRTSVSRVLDNPVLAGRRKDKDGKTVLKVEPIIDLVTRRKLQEQREKRATTRTRRDAAMLAGSVFCGKCGSPLYRQPDRKGRYFYRCSNRTCANMLKGPDLENYVSEQMTGEVIGPVEELETVVIPGHGYEDEAQQVEADIRDLDPLRDPDYDRKLATLRDQWRRLQSLPAESDQVISRMTGKTYADVWLNLDSAGRRAFLLDHGVKVHVVKGSRPSIEIGV